VYHPDPLCHERTVCVYRRSVRIPAPRLRTDRDRPCGRQCIPEAVAYCTSSASSYAGARLLLAFGLGGEGRERKIGKRSSYAHLSYCVYVRPSRSADSSVSSYAGAYSFVDFLRSGLGTVVLRLPMEV
jgi:hypothetical protein